MIKFRFEKWGCYVFLTCDLDVSRFQSYLADGSVRIVRCLLGGNSGDGL